MPLCQDNHTGLLTGIIMAEECLEVKFTAQKKKKITSHPHPQECYAKFLPEPVFSTWHLVPGGPPSALQEPARRLGITASPWGVARLLAYFSTLQFPHL